MNYFIELLVNSDNAIDQAHRERVPLPFLSTMIDDCIKRGKTPEQGGAIYNFTGPQGFGIANMADGLYAIKTLVFEEKKFTLRELKKAITYSLNQRECLCAFLDHGEIEISNNQVESKRLTTGVL